MKFFRITFLLACFLQAIFLQTGFAQDQGKFIGTWEGRLNVGGAGLRIVFNISEKEGTLDATMDSPDQGAKGIRTTRVSGFNDSLIIEQAAMGIRYSGRMVNAEELRGEFKQGTTSLLLDLKKTDKPTTIKRPQTPEPPFDYLIEDVVYYNKDSSIQYGATITVPKGKGPFPAVLLLTGSGQQNRDEELFGHKPFAVIADHLTKHGYVVLRADDRGVGKTTGTASEATSADFADDANYGVEYMRSRKEVDKKKIGLLGHSEGGMIAQIIAVRRKDIDFVIFLAAPGIKVITLMEEQNMAILEKSGATKEMANEYRKLYRSIANAATGDKDSVQLRESIAKAISEWTKATPQEIVAATTGITDSVTERNAVDGAMGSFNGPWIRYFMAYDPKPYLQKTTAKILALNGDKDIQVISASNLEGIRQALTNGKTKTFEIRELPGLNHLFQTCRACTAAEYAQLEETISPVVLESMVKWLDKEVK